MTMEEDNEKLDVIYCTSDEKYGVLYDVTIQQAEDALIHLYGEGVEFVAIDGDLKKDLEDQLVSNIFPETAFYIAEQTMPVYITALVGNDIDMPMSMEIH